MWSAVVVGVWRGQEGIVEDVSWGGGMGAAVVEIVVVGLVVGVCRCRVHSAFQWVVVSSGGWGVEGSGGRLGLVGGKAL
jgi:hypothetical protein